MIRLLKWVLIVCGLLFVVGIGISVVLGISGKDAPLHTPATVGNAPRLTTKLARDLEEDTKSGFAKRQKPQAGVYGRNGQPEYLLVAGYGFEETGKQVLDDFIEDAGKEMTFGKPSTMPGGLTCATANTNGERGSICAWAGDSSNGILWALRNRDVKAVAGATVKARAEVEVDAKKKS
jgi:hypothetical protein